MRRAVVPSSLVLLLLLAGCTSAQSTGGGEVSAAPSVAASTAPVAPLTAETPTEDASEAPATPEAAFLARVREVLPADTSIPNATDEQLLSAASQACEQMATGLDSTMVSVIEGEQKDGLGVYQDSARVAAVARQTICP